jgi:hypothetical protein
MLNINTRNSYQNNRYSYCCTLYVSYTHKAMVNHKKNTVELKFIIRTGIHVAKFGNHCSS